MLFDINRAAGAPPASRQDLHKIGHVAELLSISQRTIRYYEEQGLLTPIRSGGGNRLYTNRHIKVVQTIQNLMDMGYTVKLLQALSQSPQLTEASNVTTRPIVTHLLELQNEIKDKFKRLQQLDREVELACRQLSTEGGPGHAKPQLEGATGILDLILNQG